MAQHWRQPRQAKALARDVGELRSAYLAGWAVSALATLLTVGLLWCFHV